MFRATSCSSSGGQIILIQHLVYSLSVSGRPECRSSVPLDLHTGRSLTESDYTRCCITTIYLLMMSTSLHETCRGLKQTYYRLTELWVKLVTYRKLHRDARSAKCEKKTKCLHENKHIYSSSHRNTRNKGLQTENVRSTMCWHQHLPFG